MSSELQPPVDQPKQMLTAPLFKSPRESAVVCVLLLALMALVLYQPTMHHSFINFDDPGYVTENTHVDQGLTLKNLAWAFTATDMMNWHPVTWMSHMADVQFFGLNPAGHHLTSVALHCLNVVLLFLLVWQGTGYLWRSAMLAGIFAVFPLNVEAVAWVAERKTVLSTTFLLLALFAYGWYVRKPGAGRYLCLTCVFALGLMAKPMLVTLPLLLLMADYWPLERIAFSKQDDDRTGKSSPVLSLRWLIVEKIPLFMLSLGSGLMTLYAARHGGALSSTAQRSIGLRLENAVWSYFDYVLKTVWPSRLSILYPFPATLLPIWKVGVAAAVLVVLTALAWHYRATRYVLAGWLWFLITLAPVSGIAQVGSAGMADRFMYTACWGLLVIAVWAGAEWMSKAPGRSSIALAGFAVIVCYAWIAHVQLAYWQNSYSVFSHAVQVTSRNGIAEDNLGVALLEMGRTDLALPHLENAVQILPEFSTAHFNLGTVLQHEGKQQDAKAEYILALKYTGDPKEAARAHNNIATVLRDSNQPAAALTEFSTALRFDPDLLTSLLGRATLEYQQHDLQGATADLRRVAQVAPSPVGYMLLGQVLEAQGQLSPAIDAYESALDMAPGSSRLKAHIDDMRQKIQRQ